MPHCDEEGRVGERERREKGHNQLSRLGDSTKIIESHQAEKLWYLSTDLEDASWSPGLCFLSETSELSAIFLEYPETEGLIINK